MHANPLRSFSMHWALGGISRIRARTLVPGMLVPPNRRLPQQMLCQDTYNVSSLFCIKKQYTESIQNVSITHRDRTQGPSGDFAVHKTEMTDFIAHPKESVLSRIWVGRLPDINNWVNRAFLGEPSSHYSARFLPRFLLQGGTGIPFVGNLPFVE